MLRVIPSPEISLRSQFAELCNFRKYKIAVEVGVDQAVFSQQFIENWEGTDLYLVDPYKPYKEMLGERTADLMVAVNTMMPYHGRFKFIMLESTKAAIDLPKWVRPEFIYLDASHDYRDVKDDLAMWWKRLEPNGILAGHDYIEELPGVILAVSEFAVKMNRTVFLTAGDAPSPISWYMYKTDPSTSYRESHASDHRVGGLR